MDGGIACKNSSAIYETAGYTNEGGSSMGKIKPVCVEFKLPQNQIIPFSVIQKEMVLRNGEDPDPEYGYAADIAFLDLYANEVSSIPIPVISYSDIKDFNAWKNEFENLKASVLVWSNAVRPQIQSMPETLLEKADVIQDKLDYVISKADHILEELSSGNTPTDDINKFNEKMKDLVDRSNKAVQRLEQFHTMLTDHTTRLTQESKQFVSLSAKVTEMTAEQQKMLDDLKTEIDDYERARKGFIAGACVTGIFGAGFLAGGIAAIVLIPGAGIGIGIACFFGAGILFGGMGICIDRAISLKNKIEAAKDKQTNIENEKMTLGLIGGQFDNFATQTEDLTNAVDDIWNNWQCVSTALDNIATYADQISHKSQTNLQDWKDIANDLASTSAVLDTLRDAIKTMDIKTQIFTDCDLQGCETEEQIKEKLKEYWEEHMETQTTA